jgi:hypothetical protein
MLVVRRGLFLSMLNAHGVGLGPAGTTVSLLASYGRLDDLLHYAQLRGDYEGMLEQLLGRALPDGARRCAAWCREWGQAQASRYLHNAHTVWSTAKVQKSGPKAFAGDLGHPASLQCSACPPVWTCMCACPVGLCVCCATQASAVSSSTSLRLRWWQQPRQTPWTSLYPR